MCFAGSDDHFTPMTSSRGTLTGISYQVWVRVSDRVRVSSIHGEKHIVGHAITIVVTNYCIIQGRDGRPRLFVICYPRNECYSAFVLDFDSRRGEILQSIAFAKKKKKRWEKLLLLRAPASVGVHNSMRVDEGIKC